MPRKRIGRRGRAVGSSTAAPPQGFLSLSDATISEAAFAGQASVALGSTLVITNTGVGQWDGPTFSIGYSDATGWLTLGVTQTAAGELTIVFHVDATSLTASTQVATITIADSNCSNSGVTCTLTLGVTAQTPTIAAFPSSLTFSLPDETAGTAQSTLIFNSALGTLATPTVGVITYSGAFTNWVSSTQVTDNGDDTYTVAVTPTAVGGTVGGPYTATIPIVSAGATNTPLNVTATLTVTSAAAAVIVLDRTLDDATGTVGGTNPPTQTVGIRSGTTVALAGPVVDSTTYSGSHSNWCTATITGTTLSIAFDISAIATAGTSYANVVISDPNATATVTYQMYLKVNSTVSPAALIVSPSSIAGTVLEGQNYTTTQVAISNGGSGGLAGLGTVTATLTNAPAWASVSYASGIATLTFTTSALAASTVTSTLQIASSTATNSPINIPIQITVTAASATYPAPALTTRPEGWTWNASLGYPTGSCFNVVGPAGAADGARPAFAGTVYTIPGSYGNWSAAMAAVTAGTIVPGDIIRVDKSVTVTDAQFPVIPGWTLGDDFICVQSSDMASLPAYSYDSGPASYGVDNRGGKDAHLQYMPKFKTTTTNRSVLNFQQGGGGWWLEGLDIWADTSVPTQAIVDLSPKTGTASAARGQLSYLVQGLVFDRCRFRSTSGHQYVFGSADARYVRITHCTADFARRPGTTADSYENKFMYLVNTDGHIDVLGNQFSALGIGVLVGGAEPQITNIVPSDGTVMWNSFRVPDLTGFPDQDDFKNFFENKTGERWQVCFNRATDMWMRPDQIATFLWKAVDPANTSGGVCVVPQTLYAAHCADILIWCNFSTGAKNFTGGSDVYNGGCYSSAPLGTERVEIAYNLSVGEWTGKVPTQWVLNSSNRIPMLVSKSDGDGIPGLHIYHNTFGSSDLATDNCFLELDNISLGSGWSNVRFDNNVLMSRPLYGPVRGNQNGNTGALNGVFGAGVWNMRRNLIGPGGAQWDATLLGGNNLNGYLQAGGLGSNFTSPATYDYSLIAGHPKKNTGYGTNADPGYDHAYLVAMTSTVTENV